MLWRSVLEAEQGHHAVSDATWAAGKAAMESASDSGLASAIEVVDLARRQVLGDEAGPLRERLATLDIHGVEARISEPFVLARLNRAATSSP